MAAVVTSVSPQKSPGGEGRIAGLASEACKACKGGHKAHTCGKAVGKRPASQQGMPDKSAKKQHKTSEAPETTKEVEPKGDPRTVRNYTLRLTSEAALEKLCKEVVKHWTAHLRVYEGQMVQCLDLTGKIIYDSFNKATGVAYEVNGEARFDTMEVFELDADCKRKSPKDSITFLEDGKTLGEAFDKAIAEEPEWQRDGHAYIGQAVLRDYGIAGYNEGRVCSWVEPGIDPVEDPALWHVVMVDGDEEDLEEEEVTITPPIISPMISCDNKSNAIY